MTAVVLYLNLLWFVPSTPMPTPPPRPPIFQQAEDPNQIYYCQYVIWILGVPICISGF